MKRIASIALVVFAGLAAAASAVGPSPGESAALTVGSEGWTATVKGSATLVKSASAQRTLAGQWGFPRVAYDGTTAGLSHDGTTLVLVPQTQGQLAAPSRFALLDPRTLESRRTLSIPGRFAFDALSPDGSRLYLIQYVSVVGQLRYRVRSYDVATRKLDPRVIADKRSGWTAMEGQPLARAMPADGSWAYTLYAGETKVFVHALNTVAGYAVCIDLPLAPNDAGRLRLRLDGTRLWLVAGSGAKRLAIDTVNLQVVRSTLANG
jgi:hypothetical protein